MQKVLYSMHFCNFFRWVLLLNRKILWVIFSCLCIFCYFFFVTPLQAIFGQLQLQIVFLKTSFILTYEINFLGKNIHWNDLSRNMVESLWLEVFKMWLDMVMNNLILRFSFLGKFGLENFLKPPLTWAVLWF